MIAATNATSAPATPWSVPVDPAASGTGFDLAVKAALAEPASLRANASGLVSAKLAVSPDGLIAATDRAASASAQIPPFPPAGSVLMSANASPDAVVAAASLPAEIVPTAIMPPAEQSAVAMPLTAEAAPASPAAKPKVPPTPDSNSPDVETSAARTAAAVPGLPDPEVDAQRGLSLRPSKGQTADGTRNRSARKSTASAPTDVAPLADAAAPVAGPPSGVGICPAPTLPVATHVIAAAVMLAPGTADPEARIRDGTRGTADANRPVAGNSVDPNGSTADPSFVAQGDFAVASADGNGGLRDRFGSGQGPAFAGGGIQAGAIFDQRPVPATVRFADPPVISGRPGQIGREMGIEIARHVTAGGSEMTIRLDPVELGRIEVRMSFDDAGSLRTVMRAENSVALGMLRHESAALGQALSEAGIRSDAQSFQFDSRSSGNGDNGQPDRQPRRPADPWSAAPGADDQTTIQTYRPLRTTGNLDLIA